MTRRYQKLLEISKKISKMVKRKTEYKSIKKNLAFNQQENANLEGNYSDNDNNPSPKNILCISQTCYLILLEEDDHLLINGNYNIKILTGKVSCFGWDLDRNSNALDVKSRGRSLIPVKCIEPGSISEELVTTTIAAINTVRSKELKPQTEQKVKEFFEELWDAAIILITSTQSLQMDSITIAKNVEQIENSGLNAILYPQTFESDINKHVLQYLSINELKQKILVVGDKNSGKSFLSIYLSNYILSYLRKNLPKSAVFYLESDLGQNSFFFPATVGLFNFTEPVLTNLLQPTLYKPLVYEFVGEFSPQQFTASYLKSVENCMKFYDYSSFNCPLIINTHGYVSNIGENVLYDMIRIVKPNLVVLLDKYTEKVNTIDYGYLERNPIVKIEDEIKRRVFYDHKSILGLPNENYRGLSLWKIDLPRFKEVVAHKKEKKDSTMMTYLLNSKFFESKRIKNIPRISELCLVKPIEIPFDEHIFCVLGNSKTIFFFREHFVKFSMIFISSIVSLNYSPFVNTREKSYAQAVDFQSALTNSSSKGFGYIRDINPEKRTISIVTPLSPSEISVINLIIKSSQVQFSNELYMEDTPLNLENWMNPNNLGEAEQSKKVDKPFINDILYGVGSESYRNLKSLRKIQ